MALGFVLVGIATGLLIAVSTLVLGGGIGLALVAYVGGGLVGLLGGLASAFFPRHRVSIMASQDRG